VCSPEPYGKKRRYFGEVEGGLAKEDAMELAGGCGKGDMSLIVEPLKCVGCLICEIHCSFRATGAFNPAQARIRIERVERRENEFLPVFLTGCDKCGLCAQHCPYGALHRRQAVEKEA
jgi:ferredoxin